MTINDQIIPFYWIIDKLKRTYRNSKISDGRPESTAEHSWGACMLALFLYKYLPPEFAIKIYIDYVIRHLLLHDLTEALYGDVSAAIYTKFPSVKLMKDSLEKSSNDNIIDQFGGEFDSLNTHLQPLEEKFALLCDRLEWVIQQIVAGNIPAVRHQLYFERVDSLLVDFGLSELRDQLRDYIEGVQKL